MAALYGVRPEDRDRLARALTEVLDRRPPAVREALEALTTRRDEASAALDFERAALPHLSRTPQTWQHFAQRNAELAAGLQVTGRS
ncbi:MAG TPA: hypothetical protein VGD29_05125 [Actinoplanes sp.]|jgi:hypothetical protein